MRLVVVGVIFILQACATITEDPLDKPPEELLRIAEEAYSSREFQKAREYLDAVKARDVEKTYYAKAQLLIADSYFTTESYPEAAAEYQAFLDLRTFHEDAPYAQYRLALSYFNQVDSVDRGFENITRAKKAFEMLVKRYPRNAYRELALSKISRCNNMLAEYEAYVGTFYFNKGSYEAAAGRYEDLLSKFPDSLVEMDVMLRLGQSYEELGKKAKAGEILDQLVTKYPTSKQADEARKILKGH